MGLLSFLSSKKSDKSPNGIKSQAYHATTASLPPLRGTYPVAGNGPANVFENLQKSHNKLSQSTLSLTTGSETSVPPPLAPRFREPHGERPSTAPNGAVPTPSSGWGPRGSANDPHPGHVKPKNESISSITSKTFQLPVRSLRSSDVPYSAPLLPPSAPALQHHHRTASTLSTSSKAFVDILDAQSELKPLNFHSRIKAAGARDYGEDVADRNIGENGVNLESPQVQAFYASASTIQVSGTIDSAPGPVVARAHRGHGLEFSRLSRHSDSFDMADRTRSLTSAGIKPYPQRTSSFRPHEHSGSLNGVGIPSITQIPPPNRSSRRQSLSSFIPSAPTSNGQQTRSRPTSFYRPSHAGVEGHAVTQHRRPNTSHGSTSNELGIYSYPMPVAEHTQPLPSPRLPRDSVMLAKNNYSRPASQRSRVPETVAYEPQHSTTPPPTGGSVTNSTFSSPVHKTPAKRHSMSSAVLDTLRHADWMRHSKNDGARDGRGWAGRIDVESSVDAGPSSPAPSPHVMRAGHSRSDSSGADSLYPYQRTRSLASMSSKARLDEIYEHVPMRTSSLRNWSISSATPTISSGSSNPFARPQSRHTANTSVDLVTLSSLKSPSHTSLVSGDGARTSAYYTPYESRLHSPLTSSAAFDSSGFNIDDYLSSDDDVDADSFTSSTRRPSGVEQELLFRDEGYGFDGLQLPGLFDNFPEVHHIGTAQTIRYLRHTNSSPSPLTERSNFDHSFYAPVCGLDGDNDLEADEFVVTRADLVPGRRNTKRLSALGTMYQRIEEEKEEKVDVRTAIRLRKEAKSLKRAAARLNKVRGRADPIDIDEAHHADVE